MKHYAGEDIERLEAENARLRTLLEEAKGSVERERDRMRRDYDAKKHLVPPHTDYWHQTLHNIEQLTDWLSRYQASRP